MLFGRGSTGGVVNQVSKQAFLDDASKVNFTVGNDGFLRFVGDFNIQTGETSALRINLMRNTADNNGNFIDKEGVALNYRWGIGTRDEFVAGLLLPEQRQRHQLRPAVAARSSTQTNANPSVMIPGLNPTNVYYGAPSDYNAGGATYGTLGWTHRFDDGGELHVDAALRQLRPRPARQHHPLLPAHHQCEHRRGHQPGLPAHAAGPGHDQRRDHR